MSEPSGDPVLGTLDARRMLSGIALVIAPAVAAAALVLAHTGEAGIAAATLAAALIAGRQLGRTDLPIHLLPVYRVASRAIPPALGVATALVMEATNGDPIEAGGLIGALIGAWLVLALGFWVVARFETSHVVRVALIGPPEVATSLARELAAAGVRGYRICGWIGTDASSANAGWAYPEPPGTRLCGLEDLREAVETHGIQLLVNGPDPRRQISQERLYGAVADACLGLKVRMINGGLFYEEQLGHVPLGTIGSSWYASILHPAHRPQQSLSKRALDLTLGVIAAALTAPILLLAAIAVKLGDGGPALYRQRRVGAGGHEFTMLKLRTMRVDAEKDGTPVWASVDDDRATRIGRVLRRTHIDELPQIWNVLRGDMALVGPRPERTAFVSRLEREIPHFDRRQLMKPGITGWAQVRCGYAGTDTGVSWKLCHDLFYLRHRSLLADFMILTETLRTLFADVQYGLTVPDKQFILGEVSK